MEDVLQLSDDEVQQETFPVQSRLGAVDDLSDVEALAGPTEASSSSALGARTSAGSKQGKRKFVSAEVRQRIRVAVCKTVQLTCKCSVKYCMQQFQPRPLLDKLVELRHKLSGLEKRDADREAGRYYDYYPERKPGVSLEVRAVRKPGVSLEVRAVGCRRQQHNTCGLQTSHLDSALSNPGTACQIFAGSCDAVWEGLPIHCCRASQILVRETSLPSCLPASSWHRLQSVLQAATKCC